MIDFKEHKGIPENINVITCDMSLGFRKGIRDNFPNANMIIDKFHVIKYFNDAVDCIRKIESRTNSELKKTKYIWLKNDKNLTEKQRVIRDSLSKKHLKTARAYSMKLEIQDIYSTCYTIQDAEKRMIKLCSWLNRSRITEMKDLCRLIKDHWTEIMNYFKFRFTNAILEGLNSVIQNVKRRSRGFKNPEYFKTMIYLTCGKLDIKMNFF